MMSAGSCNFCFESISGLKRSPYGIPKPRWIGERYWQTRPRVVIVLIQPGAAKNWDDERRIKERQLFEEFYRTGNYDVIRNYFIDRYNAERNGDEEDKPFTWYETVFDLVFEEMAQINMAWCSTSSNIPSDKEGKGIKKQMLMNCFNRYSKDLLSDLEPDAIILGGKGDLSDFVNPLREAFGANRVQLVDHYARRDYGKNPDKYRSTAECRQIRQWLIELKRQLRPSGE